jgi:hypothetical protein
MLKSPIKTARWPIVNGFTSRVVKDVRFWSSMVKNKLSQKLDG